LVNHIYDYSIGDNKYSKSKFNNVIDEMTYFNVDDIVTEYVQIKMLDPKTLILKL